MGETTATRSERNKKHTSPVVLFLIKLVLFAAILTAVFVFVLGLHINRGNRMYPFLMDGDLLVTYKLEDYRVGDCVLYENPSTGKKEVSRIVAIGENEITITERGEFYIGSFVPDESVFYPTKPLEGSAIAYPYPMTSEGYFLLDDYRTIGKDSRLFGELPRTALKGKVVYVLRRRGI